MQHLTLCAALIALGGLVNAPRVVAGESGCALTVRLANAGNVTFRAELALTRQQHARGLMHRRALPAGRAMLFDFGEPRPIVMWMKDTFISLDILFFDAHGRLVERYNDAVPHSLKLIGGAHQVRYVLEINAGEARALALQARLDTAQVAQCAARAATSPAAGREAALPLR